MRLPFLRPKTPATEPARPRGRAAAATAIDDSSALQAARTRARRRLVGALVLLIVGIGGFPMLFETQPRPLPVDTPIEVARLGDGTVQQGAIQPVTQQPEPLPAPVVPPPDAGDEVAPVAAQPASVAATPVQTPTPTPAPALRTDVKPVTPAPPATLAATKPTPRPAEASAPAERVVAETAAPAKPQTVVVSTVPASRPSVTAPAPTQAPAAASGPGRYVVQVGAYSDAATLRDARAKVEKLGLKTYTQAVDTAGGTRTRVRVGPFATREDADAAAAKVKRSGLPANILAL